MTDVTLDRRNALPKIFPNQEEYLFVTGLAGPARDGAALTKDGPNMYTMAGCMGAATSMGLGMAMSAPDRKIAVIAGDGELIMNLGSLATVASQSPKNLTIVCVDNGGHGETGGQHGHTSKKLNLEGVAKSCGIENTLTVKSEAELDAAADFVTSGDGPRFLWLRVMEGEPAAFKRNMNPAECRVRFRAHAMGA